MLFSFASEFSIRITRKAIGCWNLLGAEEKKRKKREREREKLFRSCKVIDVQLHTRNSLSMCELSVIIMFCTIFVQT